METYGTEIRRIWFQTEAPVVHRPKTGKLNVKLPNGLNDSDWLNLCGASVPTWNNGYFIVAASWLNEVIKQSLERYGEVFLIQPYNEKEICASACKNASGFECQCSCLGKNHGQGEDGSGGWYFIDEALEVRWRGEVLAARHLKS